MTEERLCTKCGAPLTDEVSEWYCKECREDQEYADDFDDEEEL